MKKLTQYILVLGLSVLSLPLVAHTKEEDKSTIQENTKTTLTSTVSDHPYVTSFHGGLVLSRVCLESLTSLSSYADATATDYEACKRGLAGLVVFHLADKKASKTDILAKNGVFVWDGDHWQRISF